MFEDEERTESGLRMERMSDRDIGTARSAASYVKRIDYSCVNKADICIIEMLFVRFTSYEGKWTCALYMH